MLRKIIFILVLSAIFIFVPVQSTFAQETFGPTCEVGITCAPTAPQPTNTTAPTQPPPPTNPPRPTLPVTGPMEITYTFLGLGAFFLFAGALGIASFRLSRG